ncbi:hypothetical protein Gotur_028953 [Gossypium turneri]
MHQRISYMSSGTAHWLKKQADRLRILKSNQPVENYWQESRLTSTQMVSFEWTQGLQLQGKCCATKMEEAMPRL